MIYMKYLYGDCICITLYVEIYVCAHNMVSSDVYHQMEIVLIYDYEEYVYHWKMCWLFCIDMGLTKELDWYN